MFHSYPLLRYTLLMIFGIIVSVKTDYFDTTIYLIFIASIIGFIVSIYFKSAILRGVLASIIFFLFGWILTYHHTAIQDQFHYLNNKEFTDYQVIISSNTETKAKTYKVEADIKSIRTESGWTKSRGKVLLYFNKATSLKPIYGEVYFIKGTPREIEGPKNPNEFDYKRYMELRGIYAHHFLYENTFQKIGYQPQNQLLSYAYAANHYADSLFVKHIESPNEYAIATAVVIGTRDYIDDDLLQAYSAAGAVHVLSVSGMHVAILFVVLQFLFKRIKKKKNGKFLFATIVITLLWIYAIFTGLSSTVLRATMMFTVIQIAELISKKGNIYNTLAVSAFILLCYNPFWVLDVGFQLSYLAIIGIVYLQPYIKYLWSPTNPILKNIWEITCVSFAAQLATFPLSLYYFHQFPTYFLLANVPVFWVSELVLPIGLFLLLTAEIPFAGAIFGFILKWILWLLNKIIFFVESIPYSTLKGFSISIYELIAIYIFIIGIIYLIRYSELKYLKISLLCIVALMGWNVFEDYQQSRQQQLVFHFIPRKSGISLIEGKSSVFIADSTLLANPKIYGYHLKNFYDNIGINNQTFVDAKKYENKNGMALIEVNGKRILWLQKPFKGNIDGEADYLLLSNNALRKLNPAIQNLKFGQIIVDDSNRKYIVENLKNEADSLKINLVSLYDSGAIVR
jgi:competence protein ComEC